jgi:hypothetical protein
LRADDDVDHRSAAFRFGAFGLGDAAGKRNHRLDPSGRFSRPTSE